MNGFDLVVLIIVSFCLIRGAFKGLIREVSGIIGVIAGFYGANTYYPVLSPYTGRFLTSPGIGDLVSFLVLFCIILILVGLLAVLIRKLLNLVFLGWVDWTFGLAFGAAKGALIVSVLFILLTTFVPGHSKVLSSSVSAPYVGQIAKAMTVFISDNMMKTSFLKRWEGIKTYWKP